MQSRIVTLILFIVLSFILSSVHATDGYVGEDLGNDIYKRIDEGTYKLKKRLIENRLKGSADRINTWIGEICSTKE